MILEDIADIRLNADIVDEFENIEILDEYDDSVVVPEHMVTYKTMNCIKSTYLILIPKESSRN